MKNRWIAAALVGVVLVWGVYAAFLGFLVPTYLTQGDALSKLGQFGDMFGGLNSLFAGLAFVGVAIAAYFQRETFTAQKAQLDLAHDQHKIEKFEPLFFQLLALFRDLREKAANRKDWVVDSAHCEFSSTIAWLRGKVVDGLTLARMEVKEKGNPDEPVDEVGLHALQEKYVFGVYRDFHAQNEESLGPMFRILFHTFRLVAHSDLDLKQQVRYANIARAILDEDFLFLLMLNCMAQGHGFLPYVEHFGLLKHLRETGTPNERELAGRHFARTATMSFDARLQEWGRAGPPPLPD